MACKWRAKAAREKARGITKQSKSLATLAALTERQRWYLHLIERPDDPAKSRFEQTQVPALVIPLTDHLEDALAVLMTKSAGVLRSVGDSRPRRKRNQSLAAGLSASERPLSRNKEAIATRSEWERLLHDLLLGTLHSLYRPDRRMWTRNLWQKRKRTRKPKSQINGAGAPSNSTP